MDKKLKLLVVASIIFVTVCTFLVLSTIPLEKYNIESTQTTVLQGTSIKLYDPVVPVDVVKVFNKYTYTHIEYNGSMAKYTMVRYCFDEERGVVNDTISFNVSKSSWTLYYSAFTDNNSSEYVVLLNIIDGKILGVDLYMNNVLQEYVERNLSNDAVEVLKEPFALHEYKDIIYFLALMNADGFLVSSNNYTKIYLRDLTERYDGNLLEGFKVYVEFPCVEDNMTGWNKHQHDKWASIYGSYPVNITFNMVKLPGTDYWIITYMYVELENGIIHEYFLENIELV